MVDAAHQWLSSTAGRIATCAHSWMQAVHWVAGSGLYRPARQHGPKWGPTTLLIAQEISKLSVCRPGIEYLMRKLKVSERTVQYHLGMLREAGLLVYRVKGTRASGQPNQASVFERVVPVEFDEALGIRTILRNEDDAPYKRVPVGAAAEHRSTLGKLAKKAARKVRRRSRRTPVSGKARCTPMQVGTSAESSAASTYCPSESKLASGKKKSPTPKQNKRGPKKLNKVGRRYQLASELIQMVPWLGNASRARIAWIVRHVADAGWTALEVQAVAEGMPLSAHGVRRCSGFLAYRIAGAHQLFTTPERRKTAVEAWQDFRIAEQARHNAAAFNDLGEGPKSLAARRAMDEAFAAIRDRLTPATVELTVDAAPLALEDLSQAEVADMRAAAMNDPGLIFSALELIGEAETRRLYSNRLVDQTLALEAINARRHTLASAF
ncbi:winged helix-turn-helix domain-containing protein [Leifsonia sp. NPDC058292]|uniref:helix-turn-helix domain-containing protein n=1 Tax=Leifsonia sp. NPDC058292 TaxID=3346428 RepID=UPI0036DAF0DD